MLHSFRPQPDLASNIDTVWVHITVTTKALAAVEEFHRMRAQNGHGEYVDGKPYLMAPFQDHSPSSGQDDSVRLAVANDRKRMAAILGSAEARLQPELAAELAYRSSETAESAIRLLRVACEPLKHQPAAASLSSLPSMSQDEIDAGWRAAAEAGGLPLKPKTEAPAPARRQQDATTQSDIDRDWADAAASAGIPRK